MFLRDRENLIRFLAQNGISANAFSDAELRQHAQKIISKQYLQRVEKEKREKKKNPLAIGKNQRE